MKKGTRLTRSKPSDGAGAFLCSLAFHVLLLAVLATPSTYLPVTGDTARFEFMWLSKSSLPDDARKVQCSPAAAVREMAAGAAGSDVTTDDPEKEDSRAAVVAKPAESDGVSQVEIKDGVAASVLKASERPSDSKEPTAPGGPSVPPGAAAVSLPERESEPLSQGARMQMPASTAGVTAPLGSAARPVPETRAVVASLPPRPPEKLKSEEPSKEPVRPSTSVVPEKAVAERHLPPPVPATAAVPTPRTKVESTAPAIPAQPTARKEKDDGAAGSKRPGEGEGASEKTQPRQPSQPSQKPPEPAGLVLPAVRGDLTVIVAGDDEVTVSFLFRDYPESRRNRGMSRAQGRRTQKLSPILVKTRDKERQAVIRTTLEGVYTVLAETDANHHAEATFTLELFGLTGARKVKHLGSRSVSGRAVIAKILMPEGILWEEESAFTGSMVDSEGTTKFNTSNGLLWKEYGE